MVGDGSYLMMAQEIVMSIQERAKLTIGLVDNEGLPSIGGVGGAYDLVVRLPGGELRHIL